METRKILTILVLALGLAVWPGAMASGGQSLTVNDGPLDSISLKAGQTCTAEVAWFTSKGQPRYDCCADFNQDGSVNFLDLGIIKVNFFSGGHTPSTGNQNCPP